MYNVSGSNHNIILIKSASSLDFLAANNTDILVADDAVVFRWVLLTLKQL